MLGPEVRLGEQLIAEGLITPEQLADALGRQSASGQRIGTALVNLGALSNNSLVDALARRMGVKGCVLRHGLIDPKAAKCIPKEEAEHLRVLPMFRVHDEVTVAMTDPQSVPTIDRLQRLTGCRVRPVLVLDENLVEYQRKYLAAEVTVDAFLASIEESDVTIAETEAIDEGPVTDLDKMVEGSPVVNLVNLAILTAVRDGASDIHIEPDRDATHIRYRVDGHLRELLNPPRGMHAAIVSRVKVIGRMDIAE
ncbi:MAG TPA: ATPase, T2SS/T4P/T4SS family, partial [Phycisphaerae bacterium]|nr:ATPase, T2SS/T4P/T4SS family [Phycisphaerae bacterium]